MPFEDRIDRGAGFVASAFLALNTIGAMLDLDEITETETGEAVSDIYTLVASAVAGGSGTITVSTSAPDNYVNGRQKVGVLFDGVTIRSDIIPGIALVFNAGVANGNTSTVEVGVYVGPINAFGMGAGDPIEETRHQAHNTGAGSIEGAAAFLAAEAEYVKKVGTVFSVVLQHAVGATYKPLGGGSDQINPYRITIDDVDGSGAGKTVTMLVDGLPLAADSVLDIDTGETQDSTLLKAIDPSYFYRIVTGPLTGLIFAIDAEVLDTHTANILIYPPRHMQITGDIAGVPDEDGWGVADVPLTQAGQSEGVVLGGGDAYYWSRLVVTAGSSGESNPWQSWVFLKGVESEGANWDG